MEWRTLSDAQVSYLLYAIWVADYEAGRHDLDVWRSLADEAERRGLTDAAAEARESIAEIEAPPKPVKQREPLPPDLPRVSITIVDNSPS
jgi:hypothetical protein